MRRSTLLSVAAAVLIVACKQPAPDKPMADPAADAAAIAKVRDSYMAAWKAGDAATVSTLFTADSRSMENNQPTATGGEGVKAAMTGMMTQMTPTSIELTSEKTEVSGDMAYDRGTYKLVMTPKAAGAAPMTDSGRYLVVLRKQADGSWKLAEEMGNSATPIPMPAGKK